VGEEKPEEEPMGEGSENTFTGSDFTSMFASEMAFYACMLLAVMFSSKDPGNRPQ
jgi:hypothetical protein